MPSTFTERLRLELQEPGENDDTWGARLNAVIALIDEAADGYLAKSVAGASNVTLSTANSAADESRQRVLKLTGTLTGNIEVIAPAVEKSYVVWNATSGDFTLTFKPSGGTGIEIPQGYAARLFTDGSTMLAVSTWFNPATGSIKVDGTIDSGLEIEGAVVIDAGPSAPLFLDRSNDGTLLALLVNAVTKAALAIVSDSLIISFNQASPAVSGRAGSGSPQGVVTAAPGSFFLRTDGGNDTTLYIKATGTGNTGWRAVTTAAP